MKTVLSNGNAMSLFVLVIVFIACQVYLEKGPLPKKLQEAKLRYVLLIGIGFIALSIPIATFVPMGVTFMIILIIMASSVIAFKYRQKFEQMERGKNV